VCVESTTGHAATGRNAVARECEHSLDSGVHHLAGRRLPPEHCTDHPHPEADDMVMAADYPFLDVLWTLIIFFCWVAWIWLLIVVFSDLFRRDMSGWAKAAWIVFLIVLPFLGVLIYVIANGKEMTERRVRDAAASQEHFDNYVRSVTKGSDGGSAGEIEKAKQLRDSGAITQQEFEQLKAKALA
jgi:general stress protein CsbA